MQLANLGLLPQAPGTGQRRHCLYHRDSPVDRTLLAVFFNLVVGQMARSSSLNRSVGTMGLPTSVRWALFLRQNSLQKSPQDLPPLRCIELCTSTCSSPSVTAREPPLNARFPPSRALLVAQCLSLAQACRASMTQALLSFHDLKSGSTGEVLKLGGV